VAKTTTANALGLGLARKGYKVLLIDLDPQGNLSMSLGIPFPDEEPATVAELLLSQLQNLSGCEISPQYVKHQYGVDFIVGNDNLGNVDRMLPG
jgi:chromosome partitioning protein